MMPPGIPDPISIGVMACVIAVGLIVAVIVRSMRK